MAIEHSRERKPPPAINTRSVQFDLFSTFVTNESSEVSNAIEVWESIPKYFFTPQQMTNLRTKEGHADPYKWSYLYKDTPCAVKIQPASIEQPDGTYKAFFPGVTEELVEETLKKIFLSNGIHDPNNSESWVKFSLNMIKRELRDCGRSRDINKIKHAIEVMSSCIITFYRVDKEIWKGSILQDLVTVGRDEYLANTDSYHIARLPLFISQGINRLQYRQYNHKRLMGCDEQLSRWIYKKLINNYKQANDENTYHFKFSMVDRDSGLLQQANDRRNRAKLSSALDELILAGVLTKYDEKPYKQGRKIVDVKYTVSPTETFIKDQRASNKRAKDSQSSMLQAGVSLE